MDCRKNRIDVIKRGMDMKDVRLAAFDLDGTLLDSANKISDFTIRRFKRR